MPERKTAEYDGLTELRNRLRANDLDAALDVREAGMDVSEALSRDPPVEDMVNAGLIPPDTDRPYGHAGADRRRMIELLDRIAEAVEGDS